MYFTLIVVCLIISKSSGQIFKSKNEISNKTIDFLLSTVDTAPANNQGLGVHYGTFNYYVYSKCSISSGGTLGTYCPGSITYYGSACNSCNGLNNVIWTTYYNFNWNAQNSFLPLLQFRQMNYQLSNKHIRIDVEPTYFVYKSDAVVLNAQYFMSAFNCPFLDSIKPKWLNNTLCSIFNPQVNTLFTNFTYNPPWTSRNTTTLQMIATTFLEYCNPSGQSCYFGELNKIYCYFEAPCFIDYEEVITGWTYVPEDMTGFNIRTTAEDKAIWLDLNGYSIVVTSRIL